METDNTIKEDRSNLFIVYSDEINKAYERAVREALTKHKKDGNSVVVSRDGSVVILKPEEIEIG
jgi:isoaspartyl peptidase/L-asparaginase-like protein (Ntn-hydrolase superfamily)